MTHSTITSAHHEPRSAAQPLSARRLPPARDAGSPPRVAVVGGGLAGITAALAAADAGAHVVLYESRARLGGLTYSFRRHGLWVDNGQHVYLRCCLSYRRLLRRLGVAGLAPLQTRLDIPLRGPDPGGRIRDGRLRSARLPAPAHLTASLFGFGWLPVTGRLRFGRAAMALRTVDPTDLRTDGRSFGDWLREHGQSPAAISTLWDLFTVPTLNARADEVSLALAATVFQIGLLTDRSAADIGIPTVPLQRLHGDAATTALAAAGVDVRTSAPISDLDELDQDAAVPDGIVLATPPTVTEALLPADAVNLPAGWSGRLGGVPIINLHLVLDRPVLPEPFLATVSSPLQWIFDRTRQSGLADGQYLAVSLSAADQLADQPTRVLRERFEPELRRLLPGIADARIREFFVTREREATFRPAPGSAALRPQTGTADPRIVLAGAWTETGWPATMEGAVRSGETAATTLLRRLSTIATDQQEAAV